MEGIANRIHRFFQKPKKLDQRVFVFIFFLLISTIFWFLNALSKTYITDILFPVEYNGVPDNKMLVGDLPDKIKLTVEAGGNTLMKYQLGKRFLPISFDMKSHITTKKNKKDTSAYFIATEKISTHIAAQLDPDIKLKAVSPDSLFFRIGKVVQKKVSIRPNITYTLKKQYIIKGRKISFAPDSVIISGPKPLIDKIDSVTTDHLQLFGLEKTVFQNIKIKQEKDIKYSHDAISLEIPIEKFTQVTQKVRIRVINQPSNIHVRIFPNYLNISYFIGISKYGIIKPEQFKAVVDYKDIVTSKSQKKYKLHVKLMEAPYDKIVPNSLRYGPMRVEYLIEKK